MGDFSRHFDRRELACRCGCGTDTVDPALVTLLDDLRDQVGRPVVLRSGVRCLAHNRVSGGRPNSEHLTGHAVDVAAPTSRDRYELLLAALALGVTRIGVARGYLHLGISPAHPRAVVWTYP